MMWSLRRMFLLLSATLWLRLSDCLRELTILAEDKGKSAWVRANNL